MPHVWVRDKMWERQPGSEPRQGERVSFLVSDTGNPKHKLFEKAEDPVYVEENDVKLDYKYYFEKLKKPVNDLMAPVIGDKGDPLESLIPQNHYGGSVRDQGTHQQVFGKGSSRVVRKARHPTKGHQQVEETRLGPSGLRHQEDQHGDGVGNHVFLRQLLDQLEFLANVVLVVGHHGVWIVIGVWHAKRHGLDVLFEVQNPILRL